MYAFKVKNAFSYNFNLKFQNIQYAQGNIIPLQLNFNVMTLINDDTNRK